MLSVLPYYVTNTNGNCRYQIPSATPAIARRIRPNDNDAKHPLPQINKPPPQLSSSPYQPTIYHMTTTPGTLQHRMRSTLASNANCHKQPSPDTNRTIHAAPKYHYRRASNPHTSIPCLACSLPRAPLPTCIALLTFHIGHSG